jgi:hypothetical protein
VRCKIRPPIQKNHHPIGHSFVATNHLKRLQPQNLRSKGQTRRTVHVVWYEFARKSTWHRTMSSCCPRGMGAAISPLSVHTQCALAHSNQRIETDHAKFYHMVSYGKMLQMELSEHSYRI